MPIVIGETMSELLATHAAKGAQRGSDGMDFITEAMRQQHLRTANLADAMAAQTLRIDPLSTQVLQARAASDQPGAAKE